MVFVAAGDGDVAATGVAVRVGRPTKEVVGVSVGTGVYVAVGMRGVAVGSSVEGGDTGVEARVCTGEGVGASGT